MRLLPGLGRKCILLYEPEKVFGGCKCRLIFEKKNKNPKTEANVVVSEFTVRYRVVAYMTYNVFGGMLSLTQSIKLIKL